MSHNRDLDLEEIRKRWAEEEKTRPPTNLNPLLYYSRLQTANANTKQLTD